MAFSYGCQSRPNQLARSALEQTLSLLGEHGASVPEEISGLAELVRREKAVRRWRGSECRIVGENRGDD